MDRPVLAVAARGRGQLSALRCAAPAGPSGRRLGPRCYAARAPGPSAPRPRSRPSSVGALPSGPTGAMGERVSRAVSVGWCGSGRPAEAHGCAPTRGAAACALPGPRRAESTPVLAYSRGSLAACVDSQRSCRGRARHCGPRWPTSPEVGECGRTTVTHFFGDIAGSDFAERAEQPRFTIRKLGGIGCPTVAAHISPCPAPFGCSRSTVRDQDTRQPRSVPGRGRVRCALNGPVRCSALAVSVTEAARHLEPSELEWPAAALAAGGTGCSPFFLTPRPGRWESCCREQSGS